MKKREGKKEEKRKWLIKKTKGGSPRGDDRKKRGERKG